MLRYLINLDKSETTPLKHKEYVDALINDLEKEQAQAAFDKAWETRNFEIEMYWKRATYFWAFIASAFVGYFSALTAEKPDPDIIFITVCVGFILSMAWLLTNKGSKTWQRHWEEHIDLLEDKHTGPLYKIVSSQKTYSVSKINEIVSLVFVIMWALLGLKCYQDNEFNEISVMALIIAALALISMLFGHGRGRFTEREIKMYKRNVKYKD